MLNRLLLAFVIFFIALGLVMLPSLLTVYRGMSQGDAGFDFVGSAGENIFRVGGLIGSAALAYWLSGRLVRH
jgi:hypothetical protein